MLFGKRMHAWQTCGECGALLTCVRLHDTCGHVHAQADARRPTDGAGGGTMGFRSQLPRAEPLGVVGRVLAFVIGNLVMVRAPAAFPLARTMRVLAKIACETFSVPSTSL